MCFLPIVLLFFTDCAAYGWCIADMPGYRWHYQWNGVWGCSYWTGTHRHSWFWWWQHCRCQLARYVWNMHLSVSVRSFPWLHGMMAWSLRLLITFWFRSHDCNPNNTYIHVYEFLVDDITLTTHHCWVSGIKTIVDWNNLENGFDADIILVFSVIFAVDSSIEMVGPDLRRTSYSGGQGTNGYANVMYNSMFKHAGVIQGFEYDAVIKGQFHFVVSRNTFRLHKCCMVY